MTEEEKAQATELAEAEDIESLKKALEEERAKASEYLASWQRVQADFSNFKKRAEKEKEEVTKFANAELVASLLPVIDDLERALESAGKLAGLTWVEGIRLIYRKFLGILEAHGLCAIEAVGKDFDPSLHEAVLYEEAEEGKVLAELQRGYKFHDRVIRPAMVKVGKGNKVPPQNSSEFCGA